MSATYLAEQATLGGLLLDPSAADPILGWLRTEDFEHPWHREVFAAIRERHAARTPLDPPGIGRDLVDRLGGRKAEPARLHDLLLATPIHPDVPRYAVMVLETSLRRVVTHQGVLLQAAALASALSQERDPIAVATMFVDEALRDAESRWATAHDGHGSNPRPDTAQWSTRRGLEAALGSDRLLRAHPGLDPTQAKANEATLVAALVAQPRHIAGIATWLRVDTLTDPVWRPVYAALVQLSDLGEHVDVVTVAWEVHRAAARRGRGPGVTDLRDAVDLSVGDPARLARTVAGDQLRRTADRGAQALRTAANSAGVDVLDVVQTGHLITAALRETAVVLPQADRDDLDEPAAITARSVSRARPELGQSLGPVAG